jgi:CRP-like cAMP-binding protein
MKRVLFLFGELNDRDIDWLISHGRRESVAQGTVLIQEGKPISALFVVLAGVFRVSVGGGPQEEIARMGSGDILGEMSFVDSRPPSTTVEALVDSVVFAIGRERLSTKLAQDSAFASRFYRALCIFLSHRFRRMTLQYGAHSGNRPTPENESADELDARVLENVHLAGARFERMSKRLMAS